MLNFNFDNYIKKDYINLLNRYFNNKLIKRLLTFIYNINIY